MPDLRTDVADRVLTITIARPAARNTITYPVLDELLDVFAWADRDPDVRVVVVTGEGEFFSAGTDLSAGGAGYDAGATGFKPLRGGCRDVGGELARADLRLDQAGDRRRQRHGRGDRRDDGAARWTCASPRTTPASACRSPVAGSCPSRAPPGSCPGSSASPPRSTGPSPAGSSTPPRRSPPGSCGSWSPRDRVLERAHEVAREIATSTSAVSVALTRQLLWRQLGSPHPMSANRLESQALLALGAHARRRPRASPRSGRSGPPAFPSAVPGDLPAFYPWFTDEPFDA